MISGILSWMIFIPLIGVFVVLLLPKDNHRVIRWITVFFTFVPLVLSFFLLAAYDGGTSEFQFQ